jgi:hypothetical protein
MAMLIGRVVAFDREVVPDSARTELSPCDREVVPDSVSIELSPCDREVVPDCSNPDHVKLKTLKLHGD